MRRRPPRSTRTDTLFPYTTLFRSELADVEGAARRKSRGARTAMIYPIALEAVQRIDALFDIERTINGKSAAERHAVRQELRSEERRVGKECGSTFSTGWTPNN